MNADSSLTPPAPRVFAVVPAAFAHRLPPGYADAVRPHLAGTRATIAGLRARHSIEATFGAAMPIEKRAKIVTEFRTPEEAQQLAEMLRLIRAGEPDVTLIDEAAKQTQAVGK